MYIVDSQVHIWAANTPERPWPPGRHQPHRAVPFQKQDLIREMDAAGVHRAIIVPPSWEGDRNDLGLDAARSHPGRLAVMGRFDTEAPGANERVATWRQQPGMLGMRFTFRGASEYSRPLNEGRLDWLWAAAEKAGVPIMMMLEPAQLPLIDRAAERHPGLKLVLDHLVRISGKTDAEAFADIDQVLALAKRPNVAVKASGLPAYTADTYPYRRLHPYLRRFFDAYGPKRMFWGTDLTKLPCTYRQSVTMFTEEIPWLAAEDKEWIMGRGVCEWVGWKLP